MFMPNSVSLRPAPGFAFDSTLLMSTSISTSAIPGTRYRRTGGSTDRGAACSANRANTPWKPNDPQRGCRLPFPNDFFRQLVFLTDEGPLGGRNLSKRGVSVKLELNRNR